MVRARAWARTTRHDNIARSPSAARRTPLGEAIQTVRGVSRGVRTREDGRAEGVNRAVQVTHWAPVAVCSHTCAEGLAVCALSLVKTRGTRTGIHGE